MRYSDYSYYLGGLQDFAVNETHVHYRDPVINYFKTLDNLQNHKSIFPLKNSPQSSITAFESSITIQETSSTAPPRVVFDDLPILVSFLITLTFLRKKRLL